MDLGTQHDIVTFGQIAKHLRLQILCTRITRVSPNTVLYPTWKLDALKINSETKSYFSLNFWSKIEGISVAEPILRERRQHMILPKIPQNCIKLKEFGTGGHVPRAPLDPPLILVPVNDYVPAILWIKDPE